jgi:hypothetical protein
MIPSILRAIKPSAPWAALGVIVTVGPLLSQQAPALAFSPVYTTTGSVGAYTTSFIPTSVGFFFETTSDVEINGLGFSFQDTWADSKTYTVKLWSFDNGGLDPKHYTLLDSLVFTAPPPFYTLQKGYWWQSIASRMLPRTDAVADPSSQLGYVIAAIGDFSNSPGNVQIEGGIAAFDSRFIIAGNGFNEQSDPTGFFPVPIYDAGLGTEAYFNPNISIVPGPLPILGAAAAFSWSRRLRSRIRISK